MKTYRQFTEHVDAVEAALVDKFNVASATAEQWVLEYIEGMPEPETRDPIQVAQELFMECTV